MLKKGLLLICGLLIGISVFSQEDIKVRDDRGFTKKTAKEVKEKDDNIVIHHMFDLGTGIGLDYGGFGFKIGVSPIKRMFIFISGGYQVADFGWQIGSGFYILTKDTKHTVRPNIKVMYGTNAAIAITDPNGNVVQEYSGVYRGVTIGAGAEFRFGKSKKHGFDADLNFPFRSQQYEDDLNALKNNPNIDITDALPVQISLGYHFEF